jgi:hypothetical protein
MPKLGGRVSEARKFFNPDNFEKDSKFDEFASSNDNRFEDKEVRPLYSPFKSDDMMELKARLMETERLLAQEREKLFAANLRAKQEEIFASKVENSLKDMQQKMNSQRREKEIEEARAALKQRVEDLEKRLAMERETWIEVLRAQLSGQPRKSDEMFSASQASAHVFSARPIEQETSDPVSEKIRSLESKWEEERKKFEGLIKKTESDDTPKPSLDTRADEKIRFLEQELEKSSKGIDLLINEIASLKSSAEQDKNDRSFMSELENRFKQYDVPRSHNSKNFSSECFDSPLVEGCIKDKELLAKREEIERLRYSSAKHEKDIYFATEKLKEAEHEKTQVQKNLHELKELLSKIKAINSALERELSNSQAQKSELESKVASQNFQIVKLQQELETLQTEYSSKTLELENKVEEKTKAVAVLERDLSKITGEYEDKLLRLSAKLKATEREYQRHLDALAKEANIADQLHQEMHSYEQKVGDIEEQINSVEDKYKEQISNLYSNWEEKNSRALELEQSLSKIHSEYESKIRELEDRLKNAELKYSLGLSELNKSAEEKNEYILSLERKLEDLERDFKAILSGTMTEVTGDYNFEIQSLYEEWKNKQIYARNLEQELKKANAEQELRLSLSDSLLKYQSEDIETRIEEVKALSRQINELVMENNKLQADKQLLKKQLQSKTSKK